MDSLNHSIRTMTARIAEILEECAPSVYLYGSVVLDDFRPGWSDIDILVLTEGRIPPDRAERLVTLRQAMLEEEPGNFHYRSFEGGMLSLEGFLRGTPDTVVYWGTSGERVADRYKLDVFSLTELLESGILLCGRDMRQALRMPTRDELRAGVQAHYETIRRYGGIGERSLYSYGWLLDISRCLYTLRTGAITAKTAGAEWALREGLCPVPEELELALRVRREPRLFREEPAVLERAGTLGPAVQRYADVLEEALRSAAEWSGAAF